MVNSATTSNVVVAGQIRIELSPNPILYLPVVLHAVVHQGSASLRVRICQVMRFARAQFRIGALQDQG
jgi:hypothetical protein